MGSSKSRRLGSVAATVAAATLIVALAGVASDASAQGNSAGQGKGGGNGFAKGRGGSSGGGAAASGGSTGGAPLPLLGATALGQVAGAGGVLLIWLRRRNKRAKERATAD